MTETRALMELKKGSQRALEYFMDKYSSYVSAVIYKVAGKVLSAGDREEAASDVFMTLWNNAEKVNEGSVKSWLSAVSRNTAIKKCRGVGFELSIDEDIQLEAPEEPESQYLKKELHAAIGEALMTIPQPDREICLRRFYYGESLEEISEEMGINLSTVKSKLYRSRDKLKLCLENALKGAE